MQYLQNGRTTTTAKTKVSAAFRGSSAETQVDVPNAASASTEYAVPFGSVTNATLVEIENQTGQEVKAKVGDYASASGTLASGTKDITLANAVGDILAVVMTTSGGTPGVLSVKRKSDTEVTVQSWLSGTGIQTSDTSVVKVYNLKDLYPFNLPDGGRVVVGMEGLPTNGKITAAGVKLTGSQSGDAQVLTRVFGDPT